MDADEGEGYEHVDGDQSGGEPGDEAKDKKDATGKLDVGRDVAEPVRNAERADVVGVVVKRAMGNDFSVSVHGHRYAEREAHKQCAEGLQAVEPFRHGDFSGLRIIVKTRRLDAI